MRVVHKCFPCAVVYCLQNRLHGRHKMTPKISVSHRFSRSGRHSFRKQKKVSCCLRFIDLHYDSIKTLFALNEWHPSGQRTFTYPGNLISKSRVTYLQNSKSRTCHAINLVSIALHPATFGGIKRHAKLFSTLLVGPRIQQTRW